MPIERTITTQELAEVFDVDERTIKRWVASGCPCTKGTGRKAHRFNEGEIAKWLKDNNLSTQRGRPPEATSGELLSARVRKENALARKYEIEIGKAEGLLILKSEVEQTNIRKITVVRNGLLGLGARLAPVLEGLDGAERQRVIDEAATELLKEFAKGTSE